MLGKRVGAWRIVQQLGAGGMGAVYAAEHIEIGNRAAVKVLLGQFAHDRDMVQRFFNEARAASHIRHPGIVQVFDVGTCDDGTSYIVMELLAGESLGDRIRRQRRFSVADAVRIGRQIARTLSAAHARRIIHRDLKPDNVFLVPDAEVQGGERAKLVDFGIAKLAGDLTAAGIRTGTNAVFGTPRYMAPEQCRGAGAVDARADLYALGAILFELVCGRPPFDDEGVGAIIAAHLTVPPPRPSTLNPRISPEVEAIILQALAKDPDARQSSAAEFADQLDAITESPEASPPLPASGRREERSHPGAPTAGSLVGSLPVNSDVPARLAGAPSVPTQQPGRLASSRTLLLVAGTIVGIVGAFALGWILSSGSGPAEATLASDSGVRALWDELPLGAFLDLDAIPTTNPDPDAPDPGALTLADFAICDHDPAYLRNTRQLVVIERERSGEVTPHALFPRFGASVPAGARRPTPVEARAAMDALAPEGVHWCLAADIETDSLAQVLDDDDRIAVPLLGYLADARVETLRNGNVAGGRRVIRLRRMGLEVIGTIIRLAGPATLHALEFSSDELLIPVCHTEELISAVGTARGGWLDRANWPTRIRVEIERQLMAIPDEERISKCVAPSMDREVPFSFNFTVTQNLAPCSRDAAAEGHCIRFEPSKLTLCPPDELSRFTDMQRVLSGAPSAEHSDRRMLFVPLRSAARRASDKKIMLGAAESAAAASPVAHESSAAARDPTATEIAQVFARFSFRPRLTVCVALDWSGANDLPMDTSLSEPYPAPVGIYNLDLALLSSCRGHAAALRRPLRLTRSEASNLITLGGLSLDDYCVAGDVQTRRWLSSSELIDVRFALSDAVRLRLVSRLTGLDQDAVDAYRPGAVLSRPFPLLDASRIPTIVDHLLGQE